MSALARVDSALQNRYGTRNAGNILRVLRTGWRKLA
jgi:hypothetical protein